jgi:hypothetical protein
MHEGVEWSAAAYSDCATAFRMRGGFQNEIATARRPRVSTASAGRASGTRFALLVDMMIPSTLDHTPRSKHSRAIDTVVQRVQSEYREMPGLKLTEAQARRLWNIDAPTCRLVLTTLLEQRFLKRTPGGTYVRRADENWRAGSC